MNMSNASASQEQINNEGDSASRESLPKKQKVLSGVQDYFVNCKTNGILLNKCILCAATFSINSTSVTLSRHAETHGDLHPSNGTTFPNSGPLSLSSPSPKGKRNSHFSKMMIRWIVATGQPFSIVESAEFRNMIQVLQEDALIISRGTLQTRVASEKQDCIARIKLRLQKTTSRISLAVDAWSSAVMPGYICVTAHFIDQNWEKQSLILRYCRFETRHSSDAFATLMEDIIQSWGLRTKLEAITTDHASDVVAGVSKLRPLLRTRPEDKSLFFVHVKCFAHVINVAVKECLVHIASEISAIRSAISSIRSSVKRIDILGKVKSEFGETSATLPTVDCETCWSSTLEMVRQAYEIRKVLNATMSRIPELRANVVSDGDWEKVYKICDFLSTAATVTESSSGSNYVTYGLCAMAFNLLVRKCALSARCKSDVRQPIALTMWRKLDKDKSLVQSELALLAKILDPRFASEVGRPENVLSKHVRRPKVGKSVSASGSLISMVLQEEKCSVVGPSGEISRFICATRVGDRNMDALEWWRTNQGSFPAIAKLARDVLAIQATSVPSESTFPLAEHVGSPRRRNTDDDSICASVMLRSWYSFLK